MPRFAALRRLVTGDTCLLCGVHTAPDGFCDGCTADLPWLDPRAACPRCAQPAPRDDAVRAIDAVPVALRPEKDLPPACATCAAYPPAHDTTVAAMRYAWPLDALVPALKYAHLLAIARPLGHLLGHAVRGRPVPDLVVPVPLSAARLRERGFDQAREIARHLPAHLAARVAAEALRRITDTPPQAGLDRRARLANLAGAFVARGALAGSRIALVDDVMTSGATLHHAALALRAAGATTVDAWVVARTPAPTVDDHGG